MLNVSAQGIPSIKNGNASFRGIDVSGNNNNVLINVGINLSANDNGLKQNIRNVIPLMTYQGMAIFGESTVQVNGHSAITNNTGSVSYTTLVNISACGQFLLTEDSVLDIHYQSTNLVTDEEYGMIRAVDTGSFAHNAGTINLVDKSQMRCVRFLAVRPLVADDITDLGMMMNVKVDF